jgi:hypothetical protein
LTLASVGVDEEWGDLLRLLSWQLLPLSKSK